MLKEAQSHSAQSSLDWFNTRKQILKSIKQRVTKILGNPGLELQFYAKQYDREIRRSWKVSSKQKLVNKINTSDIVFGADFHAHAQAQRTHLRILRSLSTQRKITLALECFESRDQKIIDLYMNGKISEKKFLNKISWNKKWGFSWQHYKPLLQLAKDREYKVIGLNKYYAYTNRHTLANREQHAANILAENVKTSEGELVYVIFGELHLSNKHLPTKFEKALKRKVSATVIFQNVEKIYFDLIKKKKELTVDVVQFSQNEFCILNSPPWVKWQSYLLYLEKATDYDHENSENSQLILDMFINQLELLKTEFHLQLETGHLSVFGPGDLDIRTFTQDGRLSKPEIQHMQDQILSGHSFVIPQFHAVYIARISLNHISMMAGEWLYTSCAKTVHVPWNMPEDFTKLIWLESMGFFCSKILNPARKLDTIEDLTKKAYQNREREVDVLKICVSFKHHETSKLAAIKKWDFKSRHKSSYFEAARKLGAMMGEQMFWGYRNGTIRRRLALDWLKVSTDSKSFDRFYFEVSRILNRLPVIMKSKEERL